ncbi:MAG TPA: Hsp20/alpha crystallin family protein [Fimbriimonadaceae bacterium]|nr:Hsp20/alpha crystallin family protein [Fimbriimonadaceae bacterium]HRJ96829.1 Hsp20/alpha crystallin family protein [Fimbriimonadaceae bacterium]
MSKSQSPAHSADDRQLMKKNPLNLDPKEELRRMQAMVERRFAHDPPVRSHDDEPIPVPVDASERDGILTIKAAVPGIRCDEVDVCISDHAVTFSNAPSCQCGRFLRTVELPEDWATSLARTRFRNGFVYVRIPKSTSRHASA